MLVSRTRNLQARCLRPLLFAEPRLQYLPPLFQLACLLSSVPDPLCDQPAPIALPGMMRLHAYSNTSNCHLATTTFSSRNARSMLLASPPVNRQGRTYDLRRL